MKMDTEKAKECIEQGRLAQEFGSRKDAWEWAENAVLAIHGRLDFFAIPWIGIPAFPDWDQLESRLNLK
jgi:hypothetical protein